MVVPTVKAGQLTVTGQDPGAVRAPTCQVQAAIPELSAVFGAKAAADDAPDFSWTTMLQSAPGVVRIATS